MTTREVTEFVTQCNTISQFLKIPENNNIEGVDLKCRNQWVKAHNRTYKKWCASVIADKNFNIFKISECGDSAEEAAVKALISYKKALIKHSIDNTK